MSNEATYTFTMPDYDYSLTAQFFTQADYQRLGGVPTLSESGATITYGLYPQKHVSSSLLISVLDSLEAPEINGWYYYGGDYYAKYDATPDDNGMKFDDGTTIVKDTTYWFKCERIIWEIVRNNEEEYYVISSVLLDKYHYNRTSIVGAFLSNVYKDSDIRVWLNSDFYDSAFYLGNNHIGLTAVSNSNYTTNDKVALPMYNDCQTRNGIYYWDNDNYDVGQRLRMCKTTNLARARGSESNSDGYGLYWLSDTGKYSRGTYIIYSTGNELSNQYVDDNHTSVRPVMTITNA